MTPKDWIELVRTLGLPVVLLGATLWFIAYKLWPSQEAQAKKVNEMSERLLSEGQDRWAEISNAFVAAIEKERLVLERLVTKLDVMHQDIRDRRGK